MAITLTSAGHGGGNTVSSFNITLPDANTGDLLLMAISSEDTTTTQTVSSITGGGLTWTQIANTTASLVKGNASVWQCNQRPGTHLTNRVFTVTLSGATDSVSATVGAYRGVATSGAVYGTASGLEDTGTSSPPTRNAFTVTGANDWLVGFYMGRRTQTSVGSGFTTIDSFLQAGANFNSAVFAQFEAPGAGTFNVVFGGSNAWWAVTGLMLSAATTPVAADVLKIHGTPVETFNGAPSGTTIAGTITTTTPTVVIAVINTYNFTGSAAVRTVTGVSGGGLTWTKRSGTSGANGTSFSINQEVWWANATGSLTAQTITATLSGIPSQSMDMLLFAVSGSPSPSSPWDSHAGVPATVSKMSTGLATMTATMTTASSSAMLLGFVGYGWNVHADSTTPSGYLDISSPQINHALNCFWEAQTVAAAGSNTITWGGTQEFYQITFDALNATAGASNTGTIVTRITAASIAAVAKETFTGTVATHLTKAALAVSASTSANATGTIATHLTKASLAAVAKETFTGTVTTALTKVSQVAADVERFVGTITTTLTKLSQSLAGTIANSGTIVTTLRQPGQSVAGRVGAIGTVTTALSGISQALHAPNNVSGVISMDLSGSRVHVQATTVETFTGSITTNLSGVSQSGVIASEQFIGTITTRLSAANFAAVAEERFVGQIVMRLGTLSGQTVANVVQAEVIILGPIEMALPPFRPILLGALLGAPGSGKWYSWRYTDS